MRPPWAAHCHAAPFLSDVIRWERLRQGTDAEVWRVTRKSAETLIAKRGIASEAREAAVYRDVLAPLGIRCPAVYADWADGSAHVLLVEDLGRETLEAAPTPEGFASAARSLADMRSISAERLRVGLLRPDVHAAHYQPAERYAGRVSRLLDSASLESWQRLTLRRILERLPGYVERLYETAAAALTHNDYNAKNLVVTDTGVVAIDWSHAELSPHLGDLYCLLRDAQAYGAAAADVTDAYLAGQKVSDIAWQIQMGGLCWIIRGLHWVWAVDRDNRNREHLMDVFIRGAAECLNNLEEL